MREIKFRVWNGIEMVYDIMVGKFGIFYVNPSNNGLDEHDSASLSHYNTKYFDDIPLMQFTGLRDSIGKDIYEGDIVSGCCFNGSYTYGKVVYYKDQFTIFPTSKFVEGYNSIHDDTIVIGNIYQNPELLNE